MRMGTTFEDKVVELIKRKITESITISTDWRDAQSKTAAQTND